MLSRNSTSRSVDACDATVVVCRLAFLQYNMDCVYPYLKDCVML